MEAPQKRFKCSDRRRETALNYYYKNKEAILAKAKVRNDAKRAARPKTPPRSQNVLEALEIANSE
jgi:hypothetical protein